jgi:lysophospholipase L1-like esterase
MSSLLPQRGAQLRSIVLLGVTNLYACAGDTTPVQRGIHEPAQPQASAFVTNPTIGSMSSGASTVAPTSVPQPPLPSLPQNSASGPVLNRELLAIRYAAQAQILGKGDVLEDEFGRSPMPASQAYSPYPNGYQLGKFVALENEGALETFHEKLERLATGRDEDSKVRIVIYGASHTQGDIYTAYLRYYLQARFGNGGIGFIPLAKLNDWHRLHAATIEEQGFKLEHSNRNPPVHGHLGLLGAASVGYARHATVRAIPKNNTDPYLAATDYEVSYGADRNAGDLILLVNDVPRIQLSAKAERTEDRFFRFKMAPGWHQVEVRPAGNGFARVYGVTVERTEPGVVVDTLGIGGARISSLLSWNEEAWATQVKHRDPGLYVLAFGTNEATEASERESPSAYRTKLSAVMDRFEAALPGVSCLMVGPFDFPVETPNGYVPRARLAEIIATQREVARERGCAFWDGFAFMGGDGSMHQWVTSQPPLASPDHIHLNNRGYVRVGMGLADALMRAYDEFHLVYR